MTKDNYAFTEIVLAYTLSTVILSAVSLDCLQGEPDLPRTSVK